MSPDTTDGSSDDSVSPRVPEVSESRRRFLALSGSASVLALAGCIGGESESHDEEDTEDPKTMCLEELESEPVPDSEADALSIDGLQRDPSGDLVSKEEADYQCGQEHTGHPWGRQLCANCTFFIPDQSGDAVGACTAVEGRISSQHWCALWSPTERLEEQGMRQ